MNDLSAPRKVMVVDDEVLIANTMALILATNGYETKVAYSAESAMEALSDFSPDVLISDVIMDKLTGVDLALQLLQLRPNCRVLLMSGNLIAAQILNNRLPLGSEITLLSKPVHPQRILDFIADTH